MAAAAASMFAEKVRPRRRPAYARGVAKMLPRRPPGRAAAITALVIAASLAPAPAAADVLPPTSPECPEGSVPKKTHAGSWCEPTACDPDQGCGQGQQCRPVALCVETERYHSFGEGSAEQLRRIARGPCQADGSCARPAVCESATRCATRVTAADGWRTKIGCAATSGAAPDPEPPWLIAAGTLLLLALAALRRRA